jgi:hypothetical protein
LFGKQGDCPWLLGFFEGLPGELDDDPFEAERRTIAADAVKDPDPSRKLVGEICPSLNE